jgi:hypothetical protein
MTKSFWEKAKEDDPWSFGLSDEEYKNQHEARFIQADPVTRQQVINVMKDALSTEATMANASLHGKVRRYQNIHANLTRMYK